MSIDKHLGRDSSGNKAAAYVTPESVDKSLLVPVLRLDNRKDYGIDESSLPFVGKDIFHAYEFSTLCDSGLPAVAVLKIVYPSNTQCIVESKSLKLYLNSYNLTRMGSTPHSAINNSCERIASDLTDALGTYVSVSAFDSVNEYVLDPILNYPKLEDHIDFDKVQFTHFNEDPSLLNIVVAPKVKYQFWQSSLLRSNCKVTNQPDWADIFIAIESKNVFTPASLLQYIVSFRNEAHLHEECVEMIYKRIYDRLDEGDQLFVGAAYTRRGGIDICPVRATNWRKIEECAYSLSDGLKLSIRTPRQ